MRLVILFTIFVFANLKAFSQNTIGDKILGVWLSETKEGKIQVYRIGNKYFGKLIWSNQMFEADGKTSKKDLKNDDIKLRGRNLKDLVLLNNLIYDDGEYTGGNIYDPKNGSTYKCHMVLEGNRLNIRGYIGISLIGRTSVWTRVP